jgi:hypothetical protein
MPYAKIDDNGSVVKYPYTLDELIAENPHVSFTTEIDERTLAEFRVVSVIPAQKPPVLYDKNLVQSAIRNINNTAYVELWTYEDADPVVVVERTEMESTLVRAKRNQLLADSDWTQLSDCPVNSVAWAAYRQELRDVPQTEGFPWSIDWPLAPS